MLMQSYFRNNKEMNEPKLEQIKAETGPSKQPNVDLISSGDQEQQGAKYIPPEISPNDSPSTVMLVKSSLIKRNRSSINTSIQRKKSKKKPIARGSTDKERSVGSKIRKEKRRSSGSGSFTISNFINKLKNEKIHRTGEWVNDVNHWDGEETEQTAPDHDQSLTNAHPQEDPFPSEPRLRHASGETSSKNSKGSGSRFKEHLREGQNVSIRLWPPDHEFSASAVSSRKASGSGGEHGKEGTGEESITISKFLKDMTNEPQDLREIVDEDGKEKANERKDLDEVSSSRKNKELTEGEQAGQQSQPTVSQFLHQLQEEIRNN
jgi:hypothetical protein